jgi:glutamyl/glutaminyl-tRNA synthetase
LLGRAVPPIFVHHPLVMKSPVQKLSKSDRDTGVRDLRASGWEPSQIVGHAAWLAGLQQSPLATDATNVSRFYRSVR